MKKKIFTNFIAIASVVAMTFSLCSCGSKENATNPVGNETSDTTTLEAESSTDGEEESTSEQATTKEPSIDKPAIKIVELEWIPIGEPRTEVIDVKAGTISQLNDDGFCLLGDIYKACTYTIESIECEQKVSESDSIIHCYSTHVVSIKCQYPLSGEQNDSIEIWCDNTGAGAEAYIDINGIKKEISLDRLEGMAIVDIDERDSYKEIAILDDGPSGDPNVVFIRYVDGEIYEFGHFSSSYSGEIFTDRNGKIVSCYNCISFIQPLVISRYAEIIDNEVVYTDVDYSGALNKEYTAFMTGYGHFLETDDQTLDHGKFDYSNKHDHMEIAAGDKIKIIKADIEEEIYYVELSDGRRGLFATRNCAG